MSTGIYSSLGEYHRNLDRRWPYYALYLERNRIVLSWLQERLTEESRILDLACGEGLIVEQLRGAGYRASGIDLHHSSKYVKKGNITRLSNKEGSVDIVLLLDGLQYLSKNDQSLALKEISRVLSKQGIAIFSLPNRAHFAARVIRFFKGKYPPTDNKTHPLGDRSIGSYLSMLEKGGFSVVSHRAILPTYCLFSAFLITRFPPQFGWLLRFIDRFAIKSLSFVHVISAINWPGERIGNGK